MFHCGVLVVSGAFKDVRRRLPFLLQASSKHVRDILYVDLLTVPEVQKTSQYTRNLYDLLRETYSCTLKGYKNLDVRVILPRSQPRDSCGVFLSRDPEVAILEKRGTVADHKQWLCNRFRNSPVKQIRYIEEVGSGKNENTAQIHECEDEGLPKELMTYPCTVLGGTFDKIHNGHRLLLSVACLLCESKITVGLSDGKLLENKTLAELIEPFDVRKKHVGDFISDIKPELLQDIVPIEDAMGPTATEPNIDCLIVSQETIRGGDMINEVREANGLKKLEVHAIDLIANNEDDDDDTPSKGKENTKLSSTTERHFQLGTLLKPVHMGSKDVDKPYVIGLTGGIASGKSSICERLRKLGAQIVDCDKLGHVAYRQGSSAYDQVVQTFGEGVVAPDGNIDRKKLGEIVFARKDQLDILCSIVWPEIARLAQEQIRSYHQDGCRVVVLDAAVLLEAAWDSFVDEVWVTVLPVSESLSRIMERNALTEEQAQKRIQSQISNSERVKRANVVLSTQWEKEYTQIQVERAWKSLLDRISAPNSSL